ncbi:MAG: phosphoenolpyruvate synthase [Candidatus Azobacteroides sp.]|nr:phosphoenolpyruvate synthase [Candidatus Azobacteroides sp.]
MENALKFKQLYFKDTSFANLMNKRIFNVLLIASKYDTFMLEGDGRVDEQIFDEYMSLNLRYPPRFVQVSTEMEALTKLKSGDYNLVVSMPNDEGADVFTAVKNIKKEYPEIPAVVLTPFLRNVYQRSKLYNDLGNIDYIFSWLGNADILLAIIKLIEDKMNVEQDVASVGVQTILLVEDSIRFYSSILPYLFKFVLKQSQIFSTEALNEHQQMLRMRGRPKILLARSYEEAVALYDKYQHNMLGIISDVSFLREGVKDNKAGIRFCEYVRSKDRFVPLIMQSSEDENMIHSMRLGASFISKQSKKFPVDLRNLIMQNFGFGDFIFRDPNTMEEVGRATDLKDWQKKIFEIPSESLWYHFSHNHVSRWFYSRALFPIAEFLRPLKIQREDNIDEARKLVFDAIVQYRKMKNRGVVAVFQRDRFDKYSSFARIGEGSLGGKGRGLAFIDQMIKRHPWLDGSEDFEATIPKTVVLCTDIFDEFMDTNDLYQIALSDVDDEVILEHFLSGHLPERLHDDFKAFFEVVGRPLAIRSSSLLEDSHYQPFAGIYSTYMIPHLDDKDKMLKMLCDAIKGVYASVFYRAGKAYMTATSNIIDQEKMAVVLQEVCGSTYNNRFYPSFSGVARSLNFYPINNEKTEDGIANIALGLGKYIVDGGVTLRFSPEHPNNILQMSTLDFALRETQTQFYALDLKNTDAQFSVDDGFNLLKLSVKDAEADGSLKFIASTYDPYDQVIYDGLYEGGRKIISFANILQHDAFPLSKILSYLLKEGIKEMGRPIEIEFAVNLSYEEKNRGVFYLLQIRPIVDTKKMLNEDLTKIKAEDTILQTSQALGHGIMNDIYDIVYVKTDQFNAADNQMVAYDIEKLNRQLVQESRNYVLIGPGRWGSSDLWLGIPVKWPHISGARIIVEAGLTGYRIDPSQGTHFFQNLTSLGVGYFTINAYLNEGYYDQEFLNTQPAVSETKYLRHVRFEHPVVIKIDGKKNLGVVLKPESSS